MSWKISCMQYTAGFVSNGQTSFIKRLFRPLSSTSGYFSGIWSGRAFRPISELLCQTAAPQQHLQSHRLPPPIMWALMSPIVSMLYCRCQQSFKPFNPLKQQEKQRREQRGAWGMKAAVLKLISRPLTKLSDTGGAERQYIYSARGGSINWWKGLEIRAASVEYYTSRCERGIPRAAVFGSS